TGAPTTAAPPSRAPRREEGKAPSPPQSPQVGPPPRPAQGEAPARAAAPEQRGAQDLPVGGRVPAADAAFRFELEARSGDARAGRFTTPHGALHTPAFMPVGTHGAVKAMTPDQLRATGAAMILP